MRILFQILLGAFMVVSVQANKIYIDFGLNSLRTESPDKKGRTWNNASWEELEGNGTVRLKDKDGSLTNIKISRPKGFLGAFGNGVNKQSHYPYNAGRDRWSLEKGKVEEGTIRLSGLDTSKLVSINFFGNRDAPVELITRYAAQGKHVDLNCQNNSRKVARLRDLKPDSRGNLDVNVSIVKGPNGHLSVAVLHIKGDSNINESKTPEKSDMDKKLAELGLEEEKGFSVLMIVGIVLIGLGIVVIAGSIWYYLAQRGPSNL